MKNPTLTTEEAERLINLLKTSLITAINLPEGGREEQFDVEAETEKRVFTINIFRGRINRNKYNLSARIKVDGTVLLELHVNPTNRHYNKDSAEPIVGSHWHIYREEDPWFAVPAEDVNSDDFVHNTILFLQRFHVTENFPEIYEQEKLNL